jgi:hypothetical protein
MESRNEALKAYQRMLDTGEFQQPPDLCPVMGDFI